VSNKAWSTLRWVMAVQVLVVEEAMGAERTGKTPDPALAATVRRVVVSLPDRKLAVIADGRVLRVFETAVGAPTSPSPVGTFTIVNRITNPTYYAPGKVIASGASNPLGTRWIGLSIKGFGIHGTDQPGSIGHARSHGCIRMRNREAEELFELVRPGDVVELLAERTPELARIFSQSPSAN
jgi:lipoprotein-anchoring transpeptidase ErfK/SrfK